MADAHAAHAAARRAYNEARHANPDTGHRRAIWLAVLAAAQAAVPRVGVVWGEPPGLKQQEGTDDAVRTD